MAGSKCDYLEDKLLDHSLGVASFTMPANVYVALLTADPTDTGSTANEASGGSYAREGPIAFDAASGGATANTAAITFTEATASWGTISHWLILDAASGGNPLWHGSFDTGKAIGSGDTAEIKAGIE